MKKFNLMFFLCLFMAVVCTTTTSCKDDDDDDDSPASLVGTWKAVSGSFSGVDFEYDDQDYELMIFTDKTLTTKSFTDGKEETSETSTFNYSVSGNKLLCEGETYGTFTLSGNTLTLTQSLLGAEVKTVYKRQ